jgi:hypothetical protein
VLVVTLLVGAFLANEDLARRWRIRMLRGNRSK